MRNLNLKNGQSTVEYMLVFAAVTAVFIAFLGPSGPFQATIQRPLDVGSAELNILAGRFDALAIRQPIHIGDGASVSLEDDGSSIK